MWRDLTPLMFDAWVKRDVWPGVESATLGPGEIIARRQRPMAQGLKTPTRYRTLGPAAGTGFLALALAALEPRSHFLQIGADAQKLEPFAVQQLHQM